MKVIDEYLASLDPERREALVRLRKLVHQTASETDGAGEIEESLKWGQPAFITVKPKSGSTIRIDTVRDMPKRFAMYFICTSGLVERFREHYPHTFQYEGNRALVFEVGDALPIEELKHCIAMALTHKLKR